jgi:hypothetical protein
MQLDPRNDVARGCHGNCMQVHSPALQLSENLPDEANLNDRRMPMSYRTLCEIRCYYPDDKESIVFWGVASCSLVGIHRLSEKRSLHLSTRRHIAEDSIVYGSSYLNVNKASRIECRRKAKYRCIRTQHRTKIVNSTVCASA